MFKTKLNLRNIAAIAICLTATTLFSGCSKDDNPPAISVADNSSLTQVVYANNVQGNSGVSFTTTGAWTSSTSADWISISPNNGSSEGNYTISIILAINTTGADRTATITILCKGDRITISVTQKGKTEDGEVPNEEAEIRRLLVKLYHDTNGDNWTNKTNWLTDAPIDVWYGITYSPGNLQIILRSNNLRGTINLSGCPALTELAISDGGNYVTYLNVSTCTALTYLDCGNNPLTGLNVSGCKVLQYLYCSSKQLKNLDVSGLTALVTLRCRGNDSGDGQLTSLNASGCTALESVGCQYNQLTSLNLNGCMSLKYLSCRHNDLTDTALNTIFEALPYYTGDYGNDYDEEGIVQIYGNPGTATCNPSIAEAKRWYVNSYSQ